MTEDTSKEKKKQRSFRKKPSSSRKVFAEDPSAIAITTATSTGIEASLLEKNESKDSTDEIQFPKKSKKKKKSKSSDSQKSDEDIGESTKSLGKKSKKSKKDAIGESIKPTTTKVPSMFASASPRTKKKKSKDPSGHGKKDHSGHGKKSKTKTKTKDDRDSSGKNPSSSSANGSKPIATSVSKLDPEGSIRDIKLATPLDNSKRDSAISRLSLLPSLSTIGDSSMDDDDMPFWKRSSHGSRRNSPIASLEEDDTIYTKDEDYVKLGKYQYPGMKPEPKTQVVAAPPISDEDDSDYEDSSSSDEEPEWIKKKNMFEAKGPIGGKRVAYEPPPKEPEPTAEPEQDAEEEEEEKPKESLPPWANARKALKKTNSIRITADSATVVKEKEVKPENKQEKEESIAGLPSWAQARRANIKKTESKSSITTASPKTKTSPKMAPKQTEVNAEKEEASKTGLPAWAQARRRTLKTSESARITEAPAKTGTAPKESQENDDGEEKAKAGLPSWAIARQTSLRKSESARDTSAPVKAVEKDTEKEQVKEDEQDTAKSGLPAWATARKTLKPSGSRTNIVATTPTDGDDNGEKKNDEAVVETEKKPAWVGKKRTEMKKKSTSVDSSTLSVQTTESETDASDGQPPWAKARNSLKATSTHSVNSSAPTEKVRNTGEAKSSGVPLWAKNKSAVMEEATDVTVSAKANGDEDKPDVKAEEDAAKSVKDRLSVWGKPNQSRPPRAQSERNVTSAAASISKKPIMAKSLSERSMSSTGSQDSQATSDSHKNRMAAYLENTRKKSDTGKPPIPGIPRGSNRSVKDRSKAWGESNHSSRDGDTSSIGTGSVHSTSSPVPDYAAGRMALKKVKKDDKPSGDKNRESAPKLIRMYSSENLKKVIPPSPGKQKQDSLGSSSHSAPKLRKVGKPNEQKWKEKKTDDSEKEENPIANLKKVSPPDEKKWMSSPKVQGEGAEKLYSSQHENLRSVKPPLADESPGSADSLDSPEDDAAEFAEASEDENLNDKDKNDASDELPTNDNISDGKEDNGVEEPTSTEISDDTETSESDGGVVTAGSTPEKNITIEKGESESSEKKEDDNGAEVVVENATSVNDAVEGDSPTEEINTAAIDSDSDDTDIAANTAVTSDDGEPSEDEVKDLQKNNEGEIGSEGDEHVEEQSALTVPANDEHVEDNNLVPMPLTEDSEVKEMEVENHVSNEDASESVEGDNSLPSKEDESSKDNAVDGDGDSSKDDDSVDETQETIEDEVPPATSLEEETEADDADNDCVEKEGDSEETEKSPPIPSSEVDTIEAETEADEDVVVESDGSQIASTATSNIEMKEDIKEVGPVDVDSEKSNPDPSDSSKDDDEEQSVPQQNVTNLVNDIGDDNESSEDGDNNEEQSIEVNESTDDAENVGESSMPGDAGTADLPSDSSNDNEEASIEGETSDEDPEKIVSSPAEGKVALEPEGKVALDAEERLIPVNFGDKNEEEQKELKKTTEVDLQEALEQSNSELMKMLEQSGIFSDESAQAAISLSSFFDDKETKKSDVDKDGTRSAHSNDSSNNGSKQKPMSMKSLSDHLNRSSSGGKNSGGFMSEASPVDEESSGGWSDDDEATIKSEFTDITYGTLGSALVVDATAMTTSADAATKLRKMVSAKASQSQEDIVPGPPPDPPPISKRKSPKKPRSAKASSGGDILFKPPRPLGASDDSDSDGDEDNTRKSGVSTKKNKKKKKSKKPKDREIDVSGLFDEDDSPKKEKKKDKKKKKEKKKVPTVEEDIVFDCNENVGVEDTGAVERSKKKKKKKKRKGETAGSGDDSP